MATEYKLSYTASEIDEKLGKIDSLATKAEVPTSTSELANDSGFVTESDASGLTSSAISTHNTSTSAHADIRAEIDGKADKSEGAFYIEGSGTTDATAKVSTWTGTSDRITSYYDGLTIRYKIGIEGQSTVTLNINNLGAKTVYRFNTTKLTTQFPVGSIINLIYHADLNDGCWITNDYDANTNTQQRVYSTTTNKEYPITARYDTTTGNSYYAEYGRYSTGVTLNPSTKTITATAFKGKLTGNADTATKATQDADGNVIASTYMKTAELTGAVNDALAQAKNSGEFDGEDGVSGVYVGSGEMPDGYNVQIDPDGDDVMDVLSADETRNIVVEELAKRGQLKPEFAESEEWLVENGDTSKLYVLPDGMIWAHVLTEKEISGGVAYTNKLPQATDTDRTTIYGDDYNGDGVNDGYIKGYRLSSSGSLSTLDTACVSGFIPAKEGDTLRIKGLTPIQGTASAYVISYDSSNTKVAHKELLAVTDRTDWAPAASWFTYENGIITFPLTSANVGTGFNAIRFSFGAVSADAVVTINEEIKEGGGTTTVIEYAWVNTGRAFVPADYEDRIIELENDVKQNASDIETLKKGAIDTGGVDALTWIRQWDSPIYDRTPVWEITSEKAAITSAEKTVASVYAKYDALMAEHPDFITKTDLGLCSDGVTHIYRYDFKEREPRHQSGFEWSETKPKFIVVTGIHREWNGIYSMFHALSEITTNEELAELRRNVHFIVIPVLNPYSISGDYSVVGHALNANGVEIHRNFEVGFSVNGEGTIHYTGTTPLSEVESQYLDNILKNNTDAAYFLTCHAFDRNQTWGVDFLWGSSATKYMCNMAYRVIDKMSKAWHKKYGATWEQGIHNANSGYTALEDGDYRIGHAALTNTGGCEQRQATKYGIQATNFEVCETFFVLDETMLSAKAVTHGTEAYVNFFLTAMAEYDHKDKKQYFVK